MILKVTHWGMLWAKGGKTVIRSVIVCGVAAIQLAFFSSQGLSQETIGGGTIDNPAVGPAPSYGIGGPGFVLVKNWNFGSNGTVKNYSDMSSHFYYHNHNQVTGPQIGYGAYVVAPDNATKIGAQPVEGVNTAGPVREFTPDSLKTYIVPLLDSDPTLVKPSRHDVGSGSFFAKWHLYGAGSVLGQDILWETRVRYIPPKQFWFSPWVAGRQWSSAGGPEVDLIESYGYLYGGVWQNVNGQYWHSAVSRYKEVDYASWPNGMTSVGITGYDASQYHTITMLMRRDNTCRVFVDNVEVQRSASLPWRFAALASGIPVDMHFLFDATWGHTGIDTTDHELSASEFVGKFFEWDYSRVYVRGTAELPPLDNNSTSVVQNPAGSWISSTSAGEGRYFGADYLHDGTTGATQVKTITYTPNIPKAGQYEVYAFWPGTPAGWRSNNTRFTITHAAGSTVVIKDQNYPVVTSGSLAVAARWNSLGVYSFNQGISGKIMISNEGATKPVIADAIYFVPVERESIVVDNSDAGFTRTGTWNTQGASTSKTLATVGQYCKTSYLDDGNAGKGSKTATFTPTIPITGVYQVYGMWNNGSAARSAGVPYTITHAGGTANLAANQNINGGQWNLLGTYTFNQGTSGKVVLSNASTSGVVVADAVRFVWMPSGEEFIVDNRDESVNNSDASAALLEGTWISSLSTPGYYRDNYIHDDNAEKGPGKYVKFTPYLRSGGLYEVFARWTAAAGRAINVPIDILHASGTEEVQVDQTQNGSKWISLGSYEFPAGSTGNVQVKTAGTTGHVIADAIRFAPALPLPWKQEDVGAATSPGNTTYSSGAFTTFPSSAGFHYVYRPATGDCSITARVTSMTNNSSSWSKAGVSIRESLATDSKQAMMIISAENGSRFEYKTTTGGTHVSAGGPNTHAAPYWVRVVRSGDILTGYRSTDGINWTTAASATIAMTSNVYIGLVDYGSTSVLQNVTVTP